MSLTPLTRYCNNNHKYDCISLFIDLRPDMRHFENKLFGAILEVDTWIAVSGFVQRLSQVSDTFNFYRLWFNF